MAAIFHTIAQRAYVWHGDVYIFRIERAVEHGSLSALADAGSNPLARIDGLEGFTDGMKVVCATFGSQVLPIARLGSGFQEVPIFHEYHVGIEHLGEFFAVSGIEGVAGSITFGHDDGWTVEPYMRNDDPLAETSEFRSVMVKGLGEIGDVLFRKLLAFEGLDFGNVADGFQLVLEGRLGDGWKCQKAECQKQPSIFELFHKIVLKKGGL